MRNKTLRKFHQLKFKDLIKRITKKVRVYDDRTKTDIVYCLLRAFSNSDEPKLLYQITGLGINSILYEDKKDQLIIFIELSRPGLLIGKAGSTIDAYRDQLVQQFKKDVKIEIIEDLNSDPVLIKSILATYTDNYSWV